MNIRNTIITRIGIIYILMFLFAIIAVVKIFAVQKINTQKWKKTADNLNRHTVVVKASRGNICADDGNIIATSVPAFFVRIDLGSEGVRKVYARQSDSLALMLSQMFRDLPKAEYKRRLDAAYRQKNRGFMLTPRKVDYNELQEIKKFPILRRGQYAGGRIIEMESRRIRPLGNLAARTIGDLNRGVSTTSASDAGATGLEWAFEDYLRGESGISFKQNLSGRWVERPEIEPKDVYDVVTTLNLKIQDIAESSLKEQLLKSQASWGTVVLMEVGTGEIKAISNLGKAKNGKYQEIMNYAIGDGGCYEPGSTFKLMSLMAAIDQGLVDTSDVFDTGNGLWKYKGRPIYDSDYGHAVHGKMSVREIFEKSSNVGVAKIVTSCYEKTPGAYVERILKFGLDKQLGMEIRGEGIPYFKTPGDKNWWGTTLAWMSYGYEVKLTPLQILTFYNAVANNGKMIKPILVRSIKENGGTVKSFSTKVLNSSIASRGTINKARKMLEGVCERGTGKDIKSPNFRIAGKTGTAQVSRGSEGYGGGNYLASFVGYFPAEKPVYSMIVTIKGPKGAYYGGSVAGPVFLDIAEKVYAGFLEPVRVKEEKITERLPDVKGGTIEDMETVCDELDVDNDRKGPRSSFGKAIKEEDRIVIKSGEMPENRVPDVRGMGISNAVYLLEKAGLRVQVNGLGKVRSQSMTPGSKFLRGQTINLQVG